MCDLGGLIMEVLYYLLFNLADFLTMTSFQWKERERYKELNEGHMFC